MNSSLFFAVLVAPLLAAAASVSIERRQYGCTGTISSVADVAAAVQCTTININTLTVPGGQTLLLNLTAGTTVNLNGDILFSSEGMGTFPGPLLKIKGEGITFNGNGHEIDGQGPAYWDGNGGLSGTSKPSPMIKLDMSGVFANTYVKNAPKAGLSVNNPGPLTISGVTVDNSEGNAPNALSGGKPAGHNTDGIDLDGSDLTIENCCITNQDDCIAIGNGANINIINNQCSSGHGISIGSIGTGKHVSNVFVSGNNITNSQQALRIKTMAAGSGSSVTNITYTGNTGSNLAKFGVIIDQSYPKTMGTAGNGVQIKGVYFRGETNIMSVNSSAVPVAVNCGVGSCSDFDWSALKTSGGKPDVCKNAPECPTTGSK